MISSVRQIAVRYVQPEPEEEERLRRTVAELQAKSILRAAALVGNPHLKSGTNGEDAHAVGAPAMREEAPAGKAGAKEAE